MPFGFFFFFWLFLRAHVGMTKMLFLGMPLVEVIKASTYAPAKVGMPDPSLLAPAKGGMANPLKLVCLTLA